MARRQPTHRFSGSALWACAGLAVAVSARAQAPISVPYRLDQRIAAAKPLPAALLPTVNVTGEIPVVRLGPIDTEALLIEDRAAAASGARVARYGVGRAATLSMAGGRWIELPAERGRVWVADIEAAGALGLRVRLRDLRLPPGVTVVVYPVDDPSQIAGPYEGMGPSGSGEVWTPTRPGARLRIECRVPRAIAAVADAALFRVDGVQHIYRDPVAGAWDGPCHNDVMCHPAWATASLSRAGIGFISTNSLFCTGQLLNTVAEDQTPYLLTSNTCVGTAAAAQTCEAFFRYRTATCNGTAPALATVPRASGCTLVATNAAQDFSLLMIEGSLPTGLAWAGWTTASPPDGTPVAAIHHPQNGPQSISFGAKASNATCGGAGYIRSNWTDGPTEPGSGGAGLMVDDAQKLLIGVLSCGWSSCAALANDSFTPFSAIFAQAGSALAAGWDDQFEPNDSCSRAFSIVPGTFNARIVKSTSEDWFRATVAPGATFSAQVSFIHANGDIDVQLLTDCGLPAVASSTSQTGSESISWTNTSGQVVDVTLRVFLASDTRNTYTLTVANGPPPGHGACCLPAGCSLMTGASCNAAGGVYAGDGTTCANGCRVYSNAGPAVPIADGTGSSGCGAVATVSVNVPESFVVSGVGAGVRILHGYQGDVKFSLRHVNSGRTVSLVDRPGVPPSTFGFPNDNYGQSVSNLFRVLDAAALRYDTPVVGVDNVTGAWKPESPLSAFIGVDAAGTWQLLVQDCAQSEIGQVLAFQLTLGQGLAPSCYANCDGSTAQPLLSPNDFQCFINAFAEGSTRANCDGSTLQPILTGNDFQCFLTSFVAGCS